MINVSKDQRVTVWKVEDKGNYHEVRFTSGRKDKRTNEYVNTNWSFVRFVGNAHQKAPELKEGDRIELKGAGLSREPYEKDGERLWPKNVQFVVFNFEFVNGSGGNSFPAPELVEDDDFPF